MDNLTSDHVDALFPCEFPIKVFGKTSDAFEINVLSIIRKYVPDIRENAIRSRMTKGGHYTALTITIFAESRKQVDNIYQDLTKSPYVLMAL